MKRKKTKLQAEGLPSPVGPEGPVDHGEPPIEDEDVDCDVDEGARKDFWDFFQVNKI